MRGISCKYGVSRVAMCPLLNQATVGEWGGDRKSEDIKGVNHSLDTDTEESFEGSYAASSGNKRVYYTQ